jgi:hypothetical protein
MPPDNPPSQSPISATSGRPSGDQSAGDQPSGDQSATTQAPAGPEPCGWSWRSRPAGCPRLSLCRPPRSPDLRHVLCIRHESAPAGPDPGRSLPQPCRSRSSQYPGWRYWSRAGRQSERSECPGEYHRVRDPHGAGQGRDGEGDGRCSDVLQSLPRGYRPQHPVAESRAGVGEGSPGKQQHATLFPFIEKVLDEVGGAK